MSHRPRKSASAPGHARSLLALALWAGIVSGFAEVAVFAWPLFGPTFAARSSDAVWMVPAFDAVLFAALGVVLLGLELWTRVSWSVAAGLFSACGGLLVLLLFRQLHPLAAMIIAIGLGVQTARWVQNRAAAAERRVRRSLPWLLGSVCLLAGVSLGWNALSEHRRVRARAVARGSAPNVLLLILDTVRAADLSLYGYARRTSQELDRFAERGTTFELAFSTAPWTTPSHGSMFTGRWAMELDATGTHKLGSRWPTLAEVLHDRGYATAAFVANQLYAGWESGILKGFEHREDYPVSTWTAMASTSFGLRLYPSVRRVVGQMAKDLPLLWRLRLPRPGHHPSAENITSDFLSWLDHHHGAPFFAFLNFMDAHMPYTPPDSFRSRYHAPIRKTVSPQAWISYPTAPLTPADLRPRRDAYDGAIAYLDSQLGRLLRELDRRGLLGNTLVIIVGDHGEEFAEHGLVSHGTSLYRRSLRIPLVFVFPGRVPAGRRVRDPVTLRNLPATVLDLVGAGSTALPGRSLVRFWTGAADEPDTIMASVGHFANLPSWYPVSRGDLNSVAFDGFRYIRNEGDESEQLYDFRHDILERWNLAGSDSGRRMLPRYRAALAAWMSRAAVPRTANVSGSAYGPADSSYFDRVR